MKSTFYQEQDTKKKLAEFILQTDILSMNEQCRKFEEEFARKQSRKHAVFVTSGSAANLVLIQAMLNLGLFSKGDKIGFSALTWSTNVMPLVQLGLVPVSLDCSLDTLNVSPDEIETRVQELKGLFLTNVLGFCDNIERVKEICQQNKMVFLEDNCEALGSRSNGTLLGNFGLASTFSFFVGHHISTIEGGMICTDDDELYNMLLITRIHGWDRNLPLEKQQELRTTNNVDEFYAKYTFYDLAYNARPCEINGVIGNMQLPYWEEIVFKREGNFKLYQYLIGGNDDFIPLKVGHMDVVSNFAMPLVFKDKDTSGRYKEKFLEAGVEIRPIIAGNMTRQPFFRKYVKESKDCPNADKIHQNGLYFPNNPELTQDELETICNILEK